MLSAQEVLDRISIKEGLEHYGLEFNKNNNALCPFHREKTPSFHIYEKNNYYVCFGCGEKGNLINFVEKRFGINFREALEKIVSDFNLEPHKKMSATQIKERKEQARVERLIKDAEKRINSQRQIIEEKYIEEYRVLGKALALLDAKHFKAASEIIKSRMDEVEQILEDEGLMRLAYELDTEKKQRREKRR